MAIKDHLIYNLRETGKRKACRILEARKAHISLSKKVGAISIVVSNMPIDKKVIRNYRELKKREAKYFIEIISLQKMMNKTIVVSLRIAWM